MNDFEPYAVVKPCPDCGTDVKQIVSTAGLRMSHGVVGSVYCKNCQKKKDKEQEKRFRQHEKDHPLRSCKSCGGSGFIDGTKCWDCRGEGKKRY